MRWPVERGWFYNCKHCTQFFQVTHKVGCLILEDILFPDLSFIQNAFTLFLNHKREKQITHANWRCIIWHLQSMSNT